jgi:hypothetical protein
MAARPIRTAVSGDVLSDAAGMWMVDDVQVLSNGNVRLLVRAGRTDRGFWTPEWEPEKPVDLWTPEPRL